MNKNMRDIYIFALILKWDILFSDKGNNEYVLFLHKPGGWTDGLGQEPRIFHLAPDSIKTEDFKYPGEK